jgi:hypothetical protein
MEDKNKIDMFQNSIDISLREDFISVELTKQNFFLLFIILRKEFQPISGALCYSTVVEFPIV